MFTHANSNIYTDTIILRNLKNSQGVLKFGQNWDEIIKWSSIDRTADQIKGRYKRIVKKRTSAAGNSSLQNSPLQDKSRSRQRSLSTDVELGAQHQTYSADSSPEKDSAFSGQPFVKQLQFGNEDKSSRNSSQYLHLHSISSPKFVIQPKQHAGVASSLHKDNHSITSTNSINTGGNTSNPAFIMPTKHMNTPAKKITEYFSRPDSQYSKHGHGPISGTSTGAFAGSLEHSDMAHFKNSIEEPLKVGLFFSH